MRLTYLTDEDRVRWDRLVKLTPESGFMQSWAWSQFKEAEGQKVLRLGIFDGNKLYAGAIVYYVPSFIGSSALEIPHGPVLPWNLPECAEEAMKLLVRELERVAGEIHAPLVRIEPFLSALLPSYLGKVIRAPLDLIPTPTLIIPIVREDQDILAQMTSKGRYNVRLALRKNVEISYSTDEQAVEDFYYLFELTAERHNFSAEPQSFFQSMVQRLSPDRMVRIYFARYRGMLISGAVVTFCGKRATYLYGGSLPFLSSAMASYALHWRIMTDARAEGCQEYDFYGIAPEGQTNHPYARFSQFKLRFGGKIFKPVGAHDLYFYPQLARMWVDSISSFKQEEVGYGKSAT